MVILLNSNTKNRSTAPCSKAAGFLAAASTIALLLLLGIGSAPARAQTYICRDYDAVDNPTCELSQVRDCDSAPGFMRPTWEICKFIDVWLLNDSCSCPDIPPGVDPRFPAGLLDVDDNGEECACQLCLEPDTATYGGDDCNVIPCCPGAGCYTVANRCRLPVGAACDPDNDYCMTNTYCAIEDPDSPTPVYVCTGAMYTPPPTTTPASTGSGGNPFLSKFNLNFSGLTVTSQLGDLPFDALPSTLIEWFVLVALGVGGAVSVLAILYGAYTVMFSGGDPYKLKDGKEILTAAIAGFLFVALAVAILKILGTDILGIFA